jgi:predicted SAM-dependent methyltransferase
MDTQAIYDKYWTTGVRTDPHWSVSQIEREFRVLKDSRSILDYGCGEISRKYGDVLATRCVLYAGADVSQSVVQRNRLDGYRCELVDPSNSKTPYAAESFEGAICCEVFEHLYDPLAAARELFRTLVPGGTLVAMVPNFGYHAWRIQAVLRAQVPHEPETPDVNRYNGVHIRYFSVKTFRRLLLDAGFSDVSISAYDTSSVWDVTRGMGPMALISDKARTSLPSCFHLTWLQTLWPGLFAMRLKAEATKPFTSLLSLAGTSKP